MQVGVFCSSNKPHLWSDLYKTLSNNSVDWNLCIAGPYPPIEPLPGNVKFIQTNVKPAQCYFIAEQNTIGEYVINMADDVTLSSGSIDDLVGIINSKMTIASCYGKRHPRQSNMWKIRSPRQKITLPFFMPGNSMMHRETFNNIGIDKNFVALYWDYDIAFELVSMGGKVVISDKSSWSEKSKSTGTCHKFEDYSYVTEMWFDGIKIRNKRRKPIIPLVYNKDILKVNQGRHK